MAEPTQLTIDGRDVPLVAAQIEPELAGRLVAAPDRLFAAPATIRGQLPMALVAAPAARPAAPLLLVTTAHTSLYEHPDPDTGAALHGHLGRLLQPRHTSRAADTAYAGIPWAADNDAFVPPDIARELGAAAFDDLKQRRFLAMLDVLAGLPGCLFVTVPDVVCDASETLRLFERWHERVADARLPLGFVLQNGVEDTGVPWERIGAVFVGGDDVFKLGATAAALAREAHARGKWVHWGRVNSRKRMKLCMQSGACDSMDGSSWPRFRHTLLDKGLRWTRELAAAPMLDLTQPLC